MRFGEAEEYVASVPRKDGGMNTHVHELDVGLRARRLVEDFDRHGDLHRLAFRDPDSLQRRSDRRQRRLHPHGERFRFRRATICGQGTCLIMEKEI